jgi:hypothetical protein
MKFNLVMVSVWLAAFAPMGVLILAMVIDRHRRGVEFQGSHERVSPKLVET